ncbi:type VII secretion integral membrane protein EccD [Allostreptomyces psammosilenae]|uniref:Type VII secretion integral membrane protein EccD n=1 Tax=Allostreptomyces psammosilenae TaxID=1892865 RepID=A0A853A241_9ACTN|nr:type VII secretion integral membrane protein EccD [Allostreptomyces psammosilenae]NYI08459.1 type VII secretion integral membrane protein EccD [Allostreptomyces psammosilenae]
MSSTSTGYCRVTVVAPDSRVDVALPEDLPLAHIYPEVLRLAGQSQDEHEPTGFTLVRSGGEVLDPSQSLIAQQVRDGEQLTLRPLAQSLPPAVYDDVADAVARAVEDDRRMWNPRWMRASGLFGGALLFYLVAFVLFMSQPLTNDLNGLPAIVGGVLALVLTAFAGVRARIYQDTGTAVAMGVAALPHALLGGAGILAPDPGQGLGRLQLLMGCVALMVVAILLVTLVPRAASPFVAASLLGIAGTLGSFAAILTGQGAAEVAAVGAVVAIALVAFLPGLSARFARLPIGFQPPETQAGGSAPDIEPVDFSRIEQQARQGHEVLLGLVGGCAAVVVGTATTLGFTENNWARLLALLVGLAAMMRARLFRYSTQVVCLLVAGIAALVLLVVGMLLNPPIEVLMSSSDADLRTIWMSAAVAAGAAIVVAVGLVVPRAGVSPFWGRVMDLSEGLVLLSLVPVCLAVLDVYATVRGLTS